MSSLNVLIYDFLSDRLKFKTDVQLILYLGNGGVELGLQTLSRFLALAVHADGSHPSYLY